MGHHVMVPHQKMEKEVIPGDELELRVARKNRRMSKRNIHQNK